MKLYLKNYVGAAVLLILAVFASLALASCGENAAPEEQKPAAEGFRTVEQIKASGEIKIGVFVDKSPFGYLDENGKNVGYDIVYAQKLADDLGVKPVFVPTDAAARVSSLEANKVDVILANFTETPERKEKVGFAPPYMQVALGLVSRKSAPVASLEALGSEKLVVVKGTTAETFLEQKYPAILAKALKFEQYAEVQNALADGRAGAWLTDNTEALAFAKNSADFAVPETASSIGNADVIAPATNKANKTLLRFVTEHVSKLTAEGFFKTDYEQTLAQTYGAEFESKVLLEPADLVRYGG